ncbi:hypothetical protein FHW68_002674 [Pseudomonas sp. Tn43]|nr:hypothetical protein [Pseudomonas sp. Tn43]
MKRLFLMLLLVLPLTARSEITTQVSCFRSLEGKNINFEIQNLLRLGHPMERRGG